MKKPYKKPAVIVHGTVEKLTKSGWIPGNRKCKNRRCNFTGS
jgi:hypothetical protein